MKDLLMDPVVLGALGVIVVGFVLLVLAVRALRKSSKPVPIEELDFPYAREKPLSVVSPDSNPFSANTFVAPPPPVPVANRDVLDKVDLISQRLVDMQMLLNKQVATSVHATGAAPALSPEMLDKLLKITSTVAQQIEVLQKALGGAAPVIPSPLSSGQTISANTSNTAPATIPVSQVIGSTKAPPPPSNP